MHDITFQIYAQTLGVEVSELPSLFLKALLFDSILIGAIVAFRKRVTLKSRVLLVASAFTSWIELRIAGPMRLAGLSLPLSGLRYGLVSPETDQLPALPAQQQRSTNVHPTTLSAE